MFVSNVFIGLKWCINVNEWYCSDIIARLLGSREILVKCATWVSGYNAGLMLLIHSAKDKCFIAISIFA